MKINKKIKIGKNVEIQKDINDNRLYNSFQIDKVDACVYKIGLCAWFIEDNPYKETLPMGADIKYIGKGCEKYLFYGNKDYRIKERTWEIGTEFRLHYSDDTKKYAEVISISQTHDKKWLIGYILIDKKER